MKIIPDFREMKMLLYIYLSLLSIVAWQIFGKNQNELRMRKMLQKHDHEKIEKLKKRHEANVTDLKSTINVNALLNGIDFYSTDEIPR